MKAYGIGGYSLLDAMAVQAQCQYLSDLKYLQGWELIKLGRALEQVPADAATLFEWNDALAYLAAAPPEQTQEAARERLMTFLIQPREAGHKIINAGGERKL